MSTRILATKLYKPPSRPGAVPRPRLIERLNVGLHGKLTLISAPAGFGKTTMVTEWIDAGERRVAWLSLDAGDSDAVRFLAYVVAALQTIEPEVGIDILNLLESPQPPPIDSLLTPLLNEIATIQYDFVLVLDDYHVLDSHEIDNTLAFLIDNQPPKMHIVITTREDPRLPLARLRARGQLTEIRAADLRFTADEASEFLNQAMGLSLSQDDIIALEQRTEGWIAGLQLAAISMQGQTNPHQFVESFTGNHRFILDYLVEEVLDHQPASVQDFLFQTSILDHLSASLCDAVTSRSDSQAILERLEQNNMLIVPLDDQRQWYRYHHLFTEVLQTYARKATPNRVPIWQKRASLWCEQNGFRSDAIRYAFAAKDFERAADLIEMSWPALFNGVRPAVWLGWVKALSEDIIQTRPVLNVGCAWTYLHDGSLERAEVHLRQAEFLVYDGTRAPDVEAETQASKAVVFNETVFPSLPTTIATIYIYLAQAKGNAEAALKNATSALDLIPHHDTYNRGIVKLMMGVAYWSSGNLDAACRSLIESIDDLHLADNVYFQAVGIAILGDVKIVQGRLREAASKYEHAVQLEITESSFALRKTADRFIGFGELLREWNDLNTAHQYLQKGKKELIEQAISPGVESRWYAAMARIKMSERDFDGALTFLHEAERYYKRDMIPHVRPIAAVKARIWIVQGRLIEASGWAKEERVTVVDDLSYMREFEHITLARLLIAQSAITQAMVLLERLHQAAHEGGRNGSLIEILILQSLAYAAKGDVDPALVSLGRALSLAEPEGYVRVFVDEGEAIQPLLAHCLSRGDYVAYVKKLLDHLQPNSRSKSPNQLLIEPLSERELEVLGMLAQGHANQDVADELFIALSTVKKHVNNIYGKLNVASRTQAINRARDLGILS